MSRIEPGSLRPRVCAPWPIDAAWQPPLAIRQILALEQRADPRLQRGDIDLRFKKLRLNKGDATYGPIAADMAGAKAKRFLQNPGQ